MKGRKREKVILQSIEFAFLSFHFSDSDHPSPRCSVDNDNLT